MAAPQRQSSESERPHSPPSAQQEDDAYGGYLEDDIYDIGVADGFRPPNQDQISSISSQSDDTARVPLPSPPQRPSSAAKPPNTDNFALRHDGRMGPVPTITTPTPDASAEAPSLSRTTSITSDGPILIPEGPYVGPTRPSHTYSMYNQSNRPHRTASVATASTFNMPVERTYSGPSGPAHPYTLYPQNTVPEAEDGTPAVNSNIPIGFHTLAGQQYQRRLGPEGEDVADLIGPQGHTEELPPYTKYPDEVYARKMRENTTPSVRSSRSHARPDSMGVGAGGIGLATRNPEFSSSDDLASRPSTQPSRDSTRLSAPSVHSTAPVAMPQPAFSEKPLEDNEPRWKKRAKKKVFGIVPVWALCLAISVFVAVALLLGITLGIVLTNKQEDRRKGVDTSMDFGGGFRETGKYISIVTTTVDASPFPTMPVDLAELPVGNFSVVIPPAMPTRSQCLAKLDHLSAWSCAMPAITFQMVIHDIGSYVPKISNKQVSLTPPRDSETSWSYGTQPPDLKTMHNMTLVADFDDGEYGPAWFFQMFYDKVVVLQEGTFSSSLATLDAEADLTPETPNAGAKSGKREAATEQGKRDPDRKRKGVAYPGDKPWFCYWKGTLLEVFIYPNTTSDAGDAQIAAAMVAASAATPTPASIASVQRRHQSAAEPESIFDTPSLTTLTAMSLPAEPQPSPIASAVVEEAVAAQTGWPLYPRVVKLEERRMPRGHGFDQPFCKQFLILEDGWTKAEVLDEDGKASSIVLSEKLVSQAKAKRRTEPWNARGVDDLVRMKRSEDRRNGKGLEVGKRDLEEECHCIWMVE